MATRASARTRQPGVAALSSSRQRCPCVSARRGKSRSLHDNIDTHAHAALTDTQELAVAPRAVSSRILQAGVAIATSAWQRARAHTCTAARRGHQGRCVTVYTYRRVRISPLRQPTALHDCTQGMASVHVHVHTRTHVSPVRQQRALRGTRAMHVHAYQPGMTSHTSA